MNKKNYPDSRGKPQEYNSKPQGSQNKNQDYRDNKQGNYNQPQNQGNKNQQQQQSQGGYNKPPNNTQRPNDGYKGNREEYKQQQQPKNIRPSTSSQQAPVKEQNVKEEFKEYFEQVKTFEEKMDEFKKNLETADGYYYFLSNKAIKEWKEYLDYPNILAEKKPNISISRKPAKVNEDLISVDKIYLQYQEKQNPCSVVLKSDLVEGQDYILVNKSVWEYFSSKYPGTEIKRKGIVEVEGEGENTKKKIVLVKDMHVVTLIFIYSSYLKSLEGNKNEILRIRKLQIPLELSVKAFKSQIAKIFNKLGIFKYNIESGYLRLWSPDTRFEKLDDFREYLHEACAKSKTFDYQIEFNGTLLDRDPSSYVEEINPELKSPFIVEINQPGKLWTFVNEAVKNCKKCDYCKKIDFLEPGCQCGQVAYCSEGCKYADKGAHSAKCDKAYDSDETKEVTPSATPIDGLAGLENLGNTCYMNCSIQCLSNIKEMTDYFLSGKYLPEINEKNPLGTKGKLAKKYAYLVKRLWLENKRDLAPYSLKIAVSKFQTMFSGQHQHDAQEFLFFLLDAIHEDLNRVLDKPYTESVEGHNKTDLQVGKESWEAFLKRNQSIIVDLMYGQYKSSIECSVCKNVSKNFESFSICSLPIPNQKEIEIFFVNESYKTKPHRMLLKYPDNTHTLKDLRDDLAMILNRNPQAIQLAIGDKTSIRVLHDLSPATFQVSHDLGSKYLCAFELSQEERDIPPQRRLYVGFQTLKADFANEPKEIIGIMKLLVLDKQMTNRDVHLAIFEKYRFQFDEYWPFKGGKPFHTLSLEQACDEAFGRFKQAIYEVYIVKGTSDKVQLGQLEYDDESFSKILSKCNENEISLEVEWRYIPAFFEIEHFKSFVRVNPYKSGIQDKSNGEKRFLDISDCLRSFTEPEELDESNAWYCKKCTKHQTAFKILELYKLPKIFIIHLKRFKTGDNTRWNRTESKISDMITFPLENFNLKPFVNNPNLPSDYFDKELDGKESNGVEELNYDLVGVIHHIGSLNSGHYIAYAKNTKSGDWYLYDDERVRKVESTAQIVTDTAYILFYQRKML